MSLQRVAQEFRQQLKQQQSFVDRLLTTAHQHAVNLIKPLLDRLFGQIRGRQKQNEPVTMAWLLEDNKLQEVMGAITTHINQFGDVAKSTVMQTLQQIGQLGVKTAHAMLDVLGLLPGATTTHDYLSLDRLFTGFGQEAAKLARAALLLGVSLNKTPEEMAPHVERALNISHARALTIAKTEMGRVAKLAMLDQYRAQPDVVGWIWVCTLSKNSCAACVAMHGTKHGLDEELQDHPNGHCTMLPYTEKVRPMVQSGASWFANQDEETQKTILGPSKYQAWQDGRFEFASVVGHSHDDVYGTSIYEKSLKVLVK